MSGAWTTVWEIASRRSMTNEGEDTLSEHSLDVLQHFIMLEQAEAIRDAFGGFRGKRP